MAGSFLSPVWYRVADARPRLKPHLAVLAHRYRGQLWYVLQDRAGNRTHRLTPAAMELLDGMDGVRTLDDVWSDVAARLAGAAPSQDETLRLMGQLYQSDVLHVGDAPVVDALMERRRRHERGRRSRYGKNPLSITIPLFDPNRVLGAVHRAVSGTPLSVLVSVWIAIVAPALVLAVLHRAELAGDTTGKLLALQNLAILAAVYPAIKLLHELGHGLAVRAFGGEVHETGIMFLCFYPIPYVDASASVAFRSKWRRAGVAAAGVLVEAFLAALALYLWLLSEPGLFRTVCFNVMLIGGVSTVFVNGNPLLRFDGYYVLADVMELPNLGQRANRWWGDLAERWLLGGAPPERHRTPLVEAVWFALFAPASFVYRLWLTLSIALVVASEYLVVGILLACWSVALGAVIPVWSVLKAGWARAGRSRRPAVSRLAPAGFAGALVALCLLVPVPHWTIGDGVLWLPDDAYVRARTPGFLVALDVRSGDVVRRGDVLGRMTDPVLIASIASQEGRAAEAGVKADAERFGDQAKFALLRREVADEATALRRLRERAARLSLVAARDGRVELSSDVDLLGRRLKEGEVAGFVVPDRADVVRAIVSQDDIDLVRQKLRGVEVKLVDQFGETLSGRLVREVPEGRDELPSAVLALSGGGRFATDPRDPNGLKTVERVFQFDLAVSPVPPHPSFGTRALIRYEHDWEPIALQIGRRVRQTFLSLFHA